MIKAHDHYGITTMIGILNGLRRIIPKDEYRTMELPSDLTAKELSGMWQIASCMRVRTYAPLELL